MKELLVIKEKIKKFVGKNEVFIMPVLKFLVSFLALRRISSQMGYMDKINNPAITLIIALAGSFLPLNLTLVIVALIITANIYALSFECAVVVLALFLVLFLLYFRFASNDSIAAFLVPLSFVFKIPYVLPVSMGLVGGPTSLVSVACGTVVYYVLHYINVNADRIVNVGLEDESKLGAFKDIVDGLLANKATVVMAFAFAITVIIVYVIRRLAIKYSWLIAIATGEIACFVMVLIGKAATGADISVGGAFLGILISAILNIVLQYFCFDLDYNRTERVQFEDDEYYYYVKAVPKNTIKLSDNGKKKTVKSSSSVKNPASSGNQPVRRPQQSTDAETPARAAVRATATKAAMSNTNKGPLGMSGGRPAGEGRKKNTDGKFD